MYFLSRALYDMIIKIEFMRSMGPNFVFNFYPRRWFTRELLRDEDRIFGRLEDASRRNFIMKFASNTLKNIDPETVEWMREGSWDVELLLNYNSPLELAIHLRELGEHIQGLGLFACECSFLTNSIRILESHTSKCECHFGLMADCRMIPFTSD